jgi:phosphonate transport system ATP-binding protein
LSFALEAVGLVHPNGHRALHGVSLAAGRGERLAIIGPSGAGKTSLLRILATSLRPSEGTVRVLDTEPWRAGSDGLRALRARVGHIHQAPPIPPRQRVITAVLAGRLGRWPLWKSALSLAYPLDLAGPRDALARLNLADRLFDRCDRLSGGELQRVAVARAVYQRPDLMLADEPVSAMDPALADVTVGELHNEAQSRGATLVAGLHAVDLALRRFPRVVGIKAGAVAFDLPPVKITDRMLHELYASEGAYVPTQDNQPIEVGLPLARKPAVIRPPRTI